MTDPVVHISPSGEIFIKLPEPADRDTGAQALVLARALMVYQERNKGERRGVWRSSGVKGQVVMLFSKAERAFHAAFHRGTIPGTDHFLDLINYAGFAVRLLQEDAGSAASRERIMDGDWPW
jgi:hypothetical protein